MRHAISILGLVFLSCSGPAETRQPSPTAGGESDEPAHAAPARPAITPDAGATAVAAPTPPVDTSACAADADCAFQDPCDPQRCVAGASAVPKECEKSRPPTGTCVCFEKRCSLKPGPTHPKMTVDADCTYTQG